MAIPDDPTLQDPAVKKQMARISSSIALAGLTKQFGAEAIIAAYNKIGERIAAELAGPQEHRQGFDTAEQGVTCVALTLGLAELSLLAQDMTGKLRRAKE